MDERRWPPCRQAAATAWLLTVLASAFAVAQSPPPPPNALPPPPPWPTQPGTFADPEAFFRHLFGSTPEEQQALQRVPVSFAEERRMGRQAADGYLQSLRAQGLSTVQRGDDVRYVQRLLHQIVPLMGSAARYRELTVYVVDSPAVDARCFPGGIIIVFRGLLEFADSEAALVGIMGHELSHLDRGHLLADMRRIRLAQQALQNPRPGDRPSPAGFDPRQFMSVGRLMTQVFARPFRAEDESEADRDGAAWAFRLGYDPQAMAELFLRLSQQQDGPAAPLPSFLRSHPFHRQRYEDLTRLSNQLKRNAPGRPLYLGTENLRRRITRDQQQF